MPFDINGARKAGYSDEQISEFLSSNNPSFDVSGAQKAGYTLDDIAGTLAQPKQQEETQLPKPEQTGKTINLPVIPEITQAKPMGFMEQAGRFFSPLLGPTEAQKIEESVPFGKTETGETKYEYKPLASRLEQEQGIFTPFIPTPQLQSNTADTTSEAIGKGAFNVGAGVLGSFMSPGGILLGGVPKELESAAEGVKQIGRGAAGLFAGQMIGGIPGQVQEAINPNLPLQERIQGGLGAVVGLGFGGLAAKHAITGSKPPSPENIPGPVPEVAPSSIPSVNEKEAQITSNADALHEVPPGEVTGPTINIPAAAPEELAKTGETPITPATEAPSTVDNTQKLIDLGTQQLEHEEGSLEHTAIQAQIDELNKPAEAPVAEAQPETPNAVQVENAGEVGVRNAPTVGEGVGTENKPEVPAQKGEAPKEEVTPKYTPEVQAKLDDLKKRTDERKFQIKFYLDKKIIDNQEYQKRSKAIGMSSAAEKRQITGELTAKEQAAKDKREASNYVGKPVSVDGRNGTITGNPFGRVKVRFEDGKESTHLPEKIEAPVEAKPEAPTIEAPKEKSQLELWADNTIKESKKRLNVGLDPEVLTAYAVKGAFKIARGVKDFTAWSKEMLSEFGEAIRPHLDDLWNRANQIHEKDQASKYGPKPPSERDVYTEKLTDQLTKVLGRPPTAEEVSSKVEKKFGKAEEPVPATDIKIVGPSARLMKEAESRGEVIAPQPQEGVSPKESLDRGQDLISKGADAEQVLSNFENTKRFSTDDQDIVRAKTFELAKNAEQASKKGINSPEYIAARDAHQKWIDRSQAMISQAGSALGNLRGGNDIDTGTFYGMQDSFYKTTKSNFTLSQADKAKKLSDKVKSYSEQEQKNQTEFNQGIDNALKDVPSEPVSSPDNARKQVADAEPGSTVETNRNASVLEDEKNRIEQQLEEHKKTISDLQEELKSRPSKIKIISEKASKIIDDLASQAEKRIAERRREGRLFSGSPDPTELADYAIIGAKFIKDGALGLGEWTVKMKNKFGEAIEPFLKQIRKQSDDLISQYEKAKASKKTAKQATTDSLESEIKSAKDSISKIGKPSTEIEKETIARLEKQVKKAQSKLDDIISGKVEDPKKLLGPISERVDELQKQKSDIEKQIRDIKKKQSEQERISNAEQNLKNKAKNLEPVGENITPKQAKIIWDYAKKFYLDKGPIDFTQMVNKVADDLGLKPENILRAFASPKTMRKKIKNLIDAEYNRDVAVKAAKRWLDEQEKSWGMRNLDKSFSLATKTKIMGHGSAAPGTHAPNLLFSHPLEWLKTWGDAFKYSFTGEKGRRQNYIDNQEVKSNPNFHIARKYGVEVDPDKKQLGYEHSDSENKLIKALNKFTGGRGYDSLFSLRMRMWNSVWDRLSAEEKTDEFGHFLADWVNHQTGFAHGEYILANNLSKYVFFAKPLYKSRWGWLLGDPLTAGKNLAKWAAGKASPAEKLQATVELRTKMKFMAAYATMLGFNQMLLQATGSNQKVNWTDWKKGDWLAFKGFGYEGTPMYAMARLIRLLGNEVHVLNPYSQLTSFEKLQGGRKNVFVNNIRDYLAGGWSPGLQDIFAVVTGKDYSGNVMPWSNEKPEQGAHKLTTFQAASEMLLPIPIAEAVSQKKWTEGAVKGIASGLFGIQLRTPEDVERFSNIKSHHNASSQGSSGEFGGKGFGSSSSTSSEFGGKGFGSF